MILFQLGYGIDHKGTGFQIILINAEFSNILRLSGGEALEARR